MPMPNLEAYLRTAGMTMAAFLDEIRVPKPPIKYPPPPDPVIDVNTFKLPPEQYIGESTNKLGICLHHTVSGTASSVYHWWLDKGKAKAVRVGTSYVIDTDGKIYQFFDDRYWAFHLGTGVDVKWEKSYIGIEIVSEGGLTKINNRLLAFYDPAKGTGKVHKAQFVDLGKLWRGYQYFDQYEDVQIDSVLSLVHHLCKKHDIPRTMSSDLWNYKSYVLGNCGIITHAQVRSDKTDVHPLFPTDKLAKYCGVEFI